MIQIFASGIMLIFWLIQLKIKDASLVDLVWSLSIFISIVYLYFNLSLFDVRHLTIALLGLFWSLRLSLYLWLRIRRDTEEDRRYQAMRCSMGNYSQVGFFIFYQAQALFVTIFTTPIAIALMTTSNTVSLLDTVGIIIFIVAILGESIADKQLMHFKENNKGKRITCNKGLWYYSRHPNYFFEWLHWFAYPFFSYESQYFWVTCLAPFLMLIFLLKLTGIPHLEREALKNKPDYKDYIEKTSAFIPWFKR
ncbi:DUF1295 domain-containing protein [Gammaproteobacteria bacterium]|nr:DUF1295 domain-containing protein [Gammaproteobacteria bacterium]